MPTVNETIQKLKTFEKLPDGWHFGEGHSPSADTIKRAKQLLAGIEQLGLHQSDTFPGIDGEVMLTVYSNIDYYEFTVEPAGNVTFLYERNGRDVDYQEGMSLSEGLSKLADYEAVTWDSLGLFTNNITTVPKTISKVSLSKTPATGPAFPSFVPNALTRAAVQSVTTLVSTIGILLAAPHCIGQYQMAQFPLYALSNKIVSVGIHATITSKDGATETPESRLSK